MNGPISFDRSLFRWVIKKWKLRRFCRFHSKVHDEEGDTDHPVEKEFIEREREKPTLGDFTLGEYTEKVVVYGFLMVGSWLGQKMVQCNLYMKLRRSRNWLYTSLVLCFL